MIDNKIIQKIINSCSGIPLPKEYKEMLNKYIKQIYKWNDHINNAIDFHDIEIQDMPKLTAYQIRLSTEMDKYIMNLCLLRNEILILGSMLVLVGLNVPGPEALEKFKKAYELIEDNMLNNLVVIARYKTAIKNKKRLSLKGVTMPKSIEEIENEETWPDKECTMAFMENGCRMFHFGPRDK